jgi:carboxyl-terminal processing protease
MHNYVMSQLGKSLQVVRGVHILNRRKNIIVGIICLVLVTSVISFLASAFIFSAWSKLNPRYQISFDPKTVSIENIRKFNQVRSILKKDYYKEVDENILLEGAIAGMADSLEDPYTVYFNKEQMEMFMEKSDGSYVGIGVSITMDTSGLLTIVEPFENSPAKEVGMLQGDKIIKVDDKDVTGIRDENLIISMIRGPENTEVKITVYRPSEGKYVDFDIIRKRIKLLNIKSEVLPDNIGYVKIIVFDAEIARYFEESVNQLLAQGIEGLIIDLRDNPGGSYDQVVKIADALLPKGLIVYTEDREKNRKEENSDARELNIPITVLVNENSASASEILAGALKDHKKGTLIGTRTFGKGLVQEVVPLEDGSGLKATVAKYFTPSGVCIHDIGIKPDLEVQVPEKYKNLPASQIPKGEDIQLQTAIEVLRAKLQ